MNSVPAVIAALSLVAPASQARAPLPASAVHEAAPQPVQGEVSSLRDVPEPYRDFQASYEPEVQNQVHIEQRVIIRIAPGRPDVREDAPRRPGAREEMFARIPRADPPDGYKEKKLKGCIAIEDIAGAQPVEENRLLLFMRDHRVLSAALERACDADDFYQGFYIERNADGMLCSKRDKLQARTGASCQVMQLNRLIAVKD